MLVSTVVGNEQQSYVYADEAEAEWNYDFFCFLHKYYKKMTRKGTIIENFSYLCSEILNSYVMMQLVSNSGAVLLEREKPCTQRMHTSTLHVRSLSKGMKKTVKPVLMSKEEFFTKVVKTTDNNGNV